MNTHTKALIVSFLLSILGFFSFLPSILNNTTPFQSDEMYWIQTGRILPYILEGKFDDTYWQEYMGFTNFNGAKWIYAFGLRSFGHNDFSAIGIPPLHYEKWKKYDGSAFPPDNPLYSFVFHGRLISALTASLAIGLMFLLAFELFQSFPVAVGATILLRIHPITDYIATHALADSLFLSCELIILILVLRITQPTNRPNNINYIFLGAILGLSAAVKINAAIFYVISMVNIMVWKELNTVSKMQFIQVFMLVSIAALFSFLIVNPNLFFYPQYSLVQMIADRIEITKIHMAYFSTISPEHVLVSIPQRLTSLKQHVFTPVFLFLFTLGTISSIRLFTKNKFLKTPSIFSMLWLNLLVVLGFLLTYVVFNEQRYFLPILPFVCLVSSCWISLFAIHVSSFGRYWSASAR